MLSTDSPQPRSRPARLPNPARASKAPTSPTPRDQELLDAIVAYKRENDGCAPDLRDLMALTHMGSTSVVSHHLRHLVRLGLIEYGGKARTIRVRGGRWTLNA